MREHPKPRLCLLGKAANELSIEECEGRHVEAAAGGSCVPCNSHSMVCLQVLTAMEAKFKNSKYSMMQARGVLTFDTESVPVQQFQARCADHILQAARHPVAKVGSQSPDSIQVNVCSYGAPPRPCAAAVYCERELCLLEKSDLGADASA